MATIPRDYRQRPSQVLMTPQPTIIRDYYLKHRYESDGVPIMAYLPDNDTLKHQYFQLLSDLSTVIAYFRYSGLNRDCKVWSGTAG